MAAKSTFEGLNSACIIHIWWWFSHKVVSLFDPMDCSPSGSSVHGILQARILEWVPFSSPGDLPDPEIEPKSPAASAFARGFFITELPGKPHRLF